MAKSFYDFPVKAIDGSPASLAQYRGSVVLVVNVASACGLTPQYAGLEKTFEAYRARGFSVLGFPANEFGAQEPGTNAEIKDFCETKFGVKFPMFEKIVVKGETQHPLYRHLTKAAPKATTKPDSKLRARLTERGLSGQGPESDILWNFEKFLVNRKGEVVARFAPDIPPEDPLVTKAIEVELDKA